MCGFFAIIASSPRASLPSDVTDRIDRALAAIRHRGPDASGVHVDAVEGFALGHVRLSVIDPRASSNQPFWSECGKQCLVFNGEIYNFVELRLELEGLGVRFRTQSDTEVLLQAIRHWGESAFHRLNGMWAIVYVDIDAKVAWVSRDRWGVKPLYTFHSDGCLLLCSEVKGILAFLGEAPAPNLNSIGLYMKFGVGGEHPDSWFSGVSRFPSGEWMRLSIRGSRSTRVGSYWSYPESRQSVEHDDALSAFESTLTDAVRIRLRSDVPVGLSLSGGLDSAVIAWLTGLKCGKSLETFTSWFEPVERSELHTAQMVAARFGHRSVAVPPAPVVETLPLLADCIYHLDAGHSSTALVPYLNLCRAARRDVTVLLEGQGADELLAGYSEFALHCAVDDLRGGKLFSTWSDISQFGFMRGWGRLPLELLRSFSTTLYRHQGERWGASALLGADLSHAALGNAGEFRYDGASVAQAIERYHRGCLTNLLQYGDAISMSVNLETRCPFLDYRLVDLCFRLPTQEIYASGVSKRILRRVANNRVPDEICWSRRKDGFTNPTIEAIRSMGPDVPRLKDVLPLACDLGIFRPRPQLWETIYRLPDNIFYRAVSVLLWCDAFYGASPRWRQ